MKKLEQDWTSVSEQLHAITEEGKVLDTEQQDICGDLRKMKNTYREKQVGLSYQVMVLLGGGVA